MSAVQKYFDENGEIDAQDTSLGRNFLFFARTGEMAEFLIQKGASLNTCDKDGWSPLQEAAFYSCSRVVRALLNNGADYNVLNKRGDSALEIALNWDWTNKIVPMLIDTGCSHLNRKNINGWTPLYTSVLFRNQVTARALLRNGATCDESSLDRSKKEWLAEQRALLARSQEQ